MQKRILLAVGMTTILDMADKERLSIFCIDTQPFSGSANYNSSLRPSLF